MSLQSGFNVRNLEFVFSLLLSNAYFLFLSFFYFDYKQNIALLPVLQFSVKRNGCLCQNFWIFNPLIFIMGLVWLSIILEQSLFVYFMFFLISLMHNLWVVSCNGQILVTHGLFKLYFITGIVGFFFVFCFFLQALSDNICWWDL